MKRRKIIMLTGLCLGVSVLMLACQVKTPGTPSTPDTTAPTSAVEQTKENPTVPPLKLPEEEQKKVLQDKLRSVAEGELVQFICQDFDMDGTFEAFAIMGSKDDQMEDAYNGTLWFASDRKAVSIGDSSSYSYLERISAGQQSLVLVHKNFSSGSKSYVYGIKDAEPYEDSISGRLSGLLQLADGSFTAVQDAYDACTDGTGHTWKPYWFYYEDDFHEYGATELTLEQFKEYSGSEKILKQLEAEKGKIVNILYRENGIINVNYQTPWSRDGVDDYINNYFVTLNCKDGQVTQIPSDDNRGVYDISLMPDIAVSPDIQNPD